MANFAPTGPAAPSSVSTRSKTTPDIQNVDLILANTEYSVILPASTVAFSFRTRNCSKLRLAYTVGATATEYITIWPGETYTEEGLTDSASITLYVQSSTASEILEVWSWT